MIDFEKLQQGLPFIQRLNAEEISEFLKHAKTLQLNEREVFLEPGSLKSKIYFVKSGLIRSYLIDKKGEEITNRLRYENQVMTSYEVALLHQPTRFYFQALEPSEVFVMDEKKMQDAVDSNPNLEQGRRYFLKSTLAEALVALDDFILLSPEKRYLKFVSDHPGILNRVPMKYIANVLGITPVSLSSIRKRISTKKQ